jgi:universal stress protein A
VEVSLPCGDEVDADQKDTVDVAASLARDTGATLLVVHVHQWAEHPTGTLLDVVPHPPPDELEKLRSDVPADIGSACEFHVLHYRPPGEAGVIVDFAKSADADLIVVGTHGRSGISHLLAGSVAESIIRQAPCPVVAVKKQG